MKALMSVSSADDFEMQLCLESSRTDLDKSTSRYMFSIKTHEYGEWNDNCRGAVVTEHEEEVDVDRGKEQKAEVGISELFLPSSGLRLVSSDGLHRRSTHECRLENFPKEGQKMESPEYRYKGCREKVEGSGPS